MASTTRKTTTSKTTSSKTTSKKAPTTAAKRNGHSPTPENIRRAVAAAEKIASGRHCAGPSQHIKVRKHVAAHTDGTVEQILALAGVGSVGDLRKIASYRTPRSSLKPLAALGEKMVFAKTKKPDPWHVAATSRASSR